jgi:hypothetical protein
MFDAAHDAPPIIEAGAGRNVVAVVCTHGHNDHITVARQLAVALNAPVLLHPADAMLWPTIHPDNDFHTVDNGLVLNVGGIDLHALHTPGHCPGAVCWSAPELNAAICGDTLFHRGPGTTGRTHPDSPTILDAISQPLGIPAPHRPWSTPDTTPPPPSAMKSSTTTQESHAGDQTALTVTPGPRDFFGPPPSRPTTASYRSNTTTTDRQADRPTRQAGSIVLPVMDDDEGVCRPEGSTGGGANAPSGVRDIHVIEGVVPPL